MAMDILDEVFGLFDRLGDRAYGEAVTQRAHALQAAHFAVVDGAPDSLVAAALLHDVGQFLDKAGEAAEAEGRDARHEDRGAAFLARHFPNAVIEPIRLHVAAKRYLCAVEPGYRAALSEASELSLRLQGGPFTPEEAEAFRALPHAEEAVRLRRYDDCGKQSGLAVASLESYRPLLKSLQL
jgi:phosphonate degradation associated HDIG domain protein